MIAVMKSDTLALAVLLAVTFPLWADVFVLKDGTTIEGELKGKSGKVLMIQPAGDRRPRLVDEGDVREVRKPGEGGATQTAPEGVPVAQARSPLDDAALENVIVRAGRNAGVPEDRDKIREHMLKRWEYATEIPTNKWRGIRQSALARGVGTNVNHQLELEKTSEVKYRKNGEWVYAPGPASNTLPPTAEGISECWQKVYSSSRSDGMLIWYSTDPRAFSSWRKLTWDPELSRWAYTTTAMRREALEKFAKWLGDEIVLKRNEAAKGPDTGNLKIAADYARRVKGAQDKLESGKVSDDDRRKQEFTIRSAGDNMYERLVWAFDAEFQARALERFRATFTPPDPRVPEQWKW